jgi:hypothetical protein
MNKFVLLFLVLFLGLGIVLAQELTLDPEKFVNTQIAADTLADGIQAHSVYKVESGTYYAFDGALDVDFDLVIEGPYNGWIFYDATPPVFFQTPSNEGAQRDMINLNQGGSVTLKNILLTGLHPNDVNISSFVRNFAGYKIVWDNCAFSDHRDHCTRSTGATEEITITNCVFINGDRRGGSPFGGMPYRLDAACANLTFENNTVVNSGRLLGNGGNFFTSKMHEIHNSFLNQQVNGHEQHWFEGIQANNIFYNWSWRGRTANTNGYEAYFTTWEYFVDVENKLDSLALYNGRNLFYLEPAFTDYYHDVLADSVFPCLLWNLDIDSTILADDNFTIGKSYGDFDPMFTDNPSQIDSMLGWVYANWVTKADYSDWRITPPVTWNEDGTPNLNWPPDWDLSYSQSYLKTAGTDGLPLGDLNWFPDDKATYLANRDAYIAALQDSIANATDVYIPGDAASALITPSMVSIKNLDLATPDKFYLANNYPNPFNPTTKIAFKLAKTDKISMKIYDITGQLVKTVFDNKKYTAGTHEVTIDMSKYSSGVYFTVLNNGSQELVRKMMLIK